MFFFVFYGTERSLSELLNVRRQYKVPSPAKMLTRQGSQISIKLAASTVLEP